MKKFISIILSVIILASAAVTVSAVDTAKSAAGEDNVIYFDSTGWQGVTQVYCHIWKRGGDSFFGWQLKKESCQKVSDDKWSYNLSKLETTSVEDLKGGLKSGVDYCVIFSAVAGDNNYQTYDATFGLECIGDTLKLSGAPKVENPVDSEKSADEAVWEKNGDKFGPHLAFTSIGNIIGKFLCPNEKGTEVIGDWLPNFYNSNFIKNKVSTLAKAFPVFGIKTADDLVDVYKYIVSKKTGRDESAMKKMLEDAFLKAYPNQKHEELCINPIKVKAINKTFKVKQLKKKAQTYKAIKVTNAKGKVTYKVTKKNKKLTFKAGKLTVKKKTKKGTYKITVAVTAAGNEKYYETTVKKTVTVKVK